MLPRFFFLNVLLKPTSNDNPRHVAIGGVVTLVVRNLALPLGVVLTTGAPFPLHTSLCTFLTSVIIKMDQRWQVTKAHTKQFPKCLQFPPATWETPLFWLQQSFSSGKRSWQDCLINFRAHYWLDSYRMISPAATTCEKHLFFPLEALEGAVHLLVQLLPGSFLDRTVYHACCFNSYFNSITDGVSAGAWCQRCFLILPRTSDGSRCSSFWKAVNRKLAYFLHYCWTSIGTTKKHLQLPNEMYPLRMYTLRIQGWSGSRHVLNLEPLQWNAQQTNEEGAGAGQLAVVALLAARQQNRVCNILCHRSGAW